MPHSSFIEQEGKETKAEAAELPQSTADTFRARACPRQHITWKATFMCSHHCFASITCNIKEAFIQAAHILKHLLHLCGDLHDCDASSPFAQAAV
jgi:hypothetical protein